MTGTHTMKKDMIFSDPTHRRLYILSVILFALFLVWLYFRLFYPYVLLDLAAARLFWFRLSFVRALNRVMLALLLLHYGKLLAYLICARRSAPYRRGGAKPKACAVIPAFNEERVIVKTVQSVLASDYGRIDVYVVDDGSTDRTAEVVEAAFRGDRRVHLLRQENSGKAAALNRGIA